MTRLDDAEKIACEFHETYERLAPKFGWGTQERARVAWSDLPPENAHLMIATINNLLTRDIIRKGDVKLF